MKDDWPASYKHETNSIRRQTAAERKPHMRLDRARVLASMLLLGALSTTAANAETPRTKTWQLRNGTKITLEKTYDAAGTLLRSTRTAAGKPRTITMRGDHWTRSASNTPYTRTEKTYEGGVLTTLTKSSTAPTKIDFTDRVATVRFDSRGNEIESEVKTRWRLGVGTLDGTMRKESRLGDNMSGIQYRLSSGAVSSVVRPSRTLKQVTADAFKLPANMLRPLPGSLPPTQ